ncbi:hypothetical protein [Paraferrimonas sedimenticola]|uniref:Uncharacterized protein n=1 Tax=Paraferrimonas sedimenticola TaxID=375674 RepID=A0AA37RUB7_9GAMM|nr:hypothetical protein [Paraferrimonas sedimenticola]GLP95301.1 hypothetical protein GCM10007895_06070 [Paraferrimonas sedimenticola]
MNSNKPKVAGLPNQFHIDLKPWVDPDGIRQSVFRAEDSVIKQACRQIAELQEKTAEQALILRLRRELDEAMKSESKVLVRLVEHIKKKAKSDMDALLKVRECISLLQTKFEEIEDEITRKQYKRTP